MLPVSRWAQATAQLVHDQIGAHTTVKSAPRKGDYVFELPAIHHSWPSLCTNPLQQVAELCEPLCSGLYGDVDHITQLLAELETHYDSCESEEEDDDELSDEDFTDLLEWDLNTKSTPNTSWTILPPIPSIIVTPCSTQPSTDREVCRVPLQDRGFGQQLTVPFHPTSNNAHPPHRITPGSDPHAALFDCSWRWNKGHWEAIIPCLLEQRRRGLYSRPSLPRRKGGRSSAGILVPRRFSRTA